MTNKDKDNSNNINNTDLDFNIELKDCVNTSYTGIQFPDLDSLKSRLVVIPNQVFRLYGCLACSWRNTSECPFFDVNKGCKRNDLSYPKEGICARRKVWLLLLTPDYVEPISLSQWKRDFMLSLGSINMEREFTLINDYEDKLVMLGVFDNIDDDKVRKRYNFLDNQLTSRKKYSLQLWNQVLKYTDNQVDRDTVRVSKVEKITIKPSDIAGLLRDVPVEIHESYDEIKDSGIALSSNDESDGEVLSETNEDDN